MIRAATIDDVSRLLELGQMLHAESPRWRRLSFDVAKVEAQLLDLITSPDGFAWVACDAGGRVIGGLLAQVGEHWSSRDLVAQELSFFVEPSARGALCAARLIAVADAWAEGKGAKWLQVGTSTAIDPERTAQLYERLGFDRFGIGLERVYGT